MKIRAALLSLNMISYLLLMAFLTLQNMPFHTSLILHGHCLSTTIHFACVDVLLSLCESGKDQKTLIIIAR